MKVVIIEGARGTGKSTVARKIREQISEITLVNPTGFHLDGKEGLAKISKYYDKWLDLLWSMKDEDVTLVFDRFFFSEMVFSKLYKSYDFSKQYDELLFDLRTLPCDIDIIFFTIDDEEELKSRLVRDKVPFGKAEETVSETSKQQVVYKDIMSDILAEYSSDTFRLSYVDTTQKTPEQVQEEVFKIIKGEENAK
jgi:deoxyguanosine kinase